MPLDLTKPVQLTDGRPVRIICTDAGVKWPIVGMVLDNSVVVRFAVDGTPPTFGGCHLQNIPPPARFVWINVYATDWCWSDTLEDANRHASPGRLRLLQVNIDTGETKVHKP